MTTSPIAPDVRRFLLARIASVPHMEALMLLRTNAAQRWDPPELARRLYVTPATAVALLNDLAAARLLQRTDGHGSFRYAPSSDLEPVLEQLATLYRSHLVEVTRLIHAFSAGKAQPGAATGD